MIRITFFGAIALMIALSSTPAEACGCPCDTDTDCHHGEVCNLSSGTCIDPDGPCSGDADCGGGQLCNPSTGLCQDRTDECSCNEDCDDGLFCNGVESCDVFAGCVVDSAVDCSAFDEFCALGVCDEESQSCVTVPQNEGLDCGDEPQDSCVLASVCSDGACVAVPLCDGQCERCDPEGCVSLCGNPWGSDNDTINSTDALFTLRAAVDLEQCNPCICDVNGDGAISCTDTLMMLRHIVGLGDVFVCSPSAGPDETTTTTTLPML
jgi:hypothetical protein